MSDSSCREKEILAEKMAKDGKNEEATNLFNSAAECWLRWESFADAARAYERTYEHAMLCHYYARAAEVMIAAGKAWLRQGHHDKFEIDCQIAAEAYIMAAEGEKNPKRFVDGVFCSIMGGDLELAKQLIHAAVETTRGEMKDLINLALMLMEYEFGDADIYIENVLKRSLTRDQLREVQDIFYLMFVGFVRTSLESEAALSIASLAESIGLRPSVVERLARKGTYSGVIPAYFDESAKELIVDTDRFDTATLARRKGPIMSRDLEDPGAWDMDLEE